MTVLYNYRKVATFGLSQYQREFSFNSVRKIQENLGTTLPVSTYWTPGCLRINLTSSVTALAIRLKRDGEGGGGRTYASMKERSK